MSSGPLSEQSVPLNCGAGFVQVRVFFIIPPPQVALQGDQEDHSVYPPLTKTRQLNGKALSSFYGHNLTLLNAIRAIWEILVILLLQPRYFLTMVIWPFSTRRLPWISLCTYIGHTYLDIALCHILVTRRLLQAGYSLSRHWQELDWRMFLFSAAYLLHKSHCKLKIHSMGNNHRWLKNNAHWLERKLYEKKTT